MIETVMAERCGGCAFRPGTAASRSPLTMLTAKLCVMGREPFFCHSHPGRDEPQHLCRGYVDTLAVDLARPASEQPQEWQQVFARALNDRLGEARSGPAPVTDDECAALIREAMEATEAALSGASPL